MILYGFTDLLPAMTHEPDECPRCDAALRMNNGLCLQCLLQVGLTEDVEFGSESLEALLAEIE
jgi:predicted amidophosphoribosyltransferase